VVPWVPAGAFLSFDPRDKEQNIAERDRWVGRQQHRLGERQLKYPLSAAWSHGWLQGGAAGSTDLWPQAVAAGKRVKQRAERQRSAPAEHARACGARIAPSARRCAGVGSAAQLPRARSQPARSWGRGAEGSPSSVRDKCAFVGTGSGLGVGGRCLLVPSDLAPCSSQGFKAQLDPAW